MAEAKNRCLSSQYHIKIVLDDIIDGVITDIEILFK
jgi:hypothetical protein